MNKTAKSKKTDSLKTSLNYMDICDQKTIVDESTCNGKRKVSTLEGIEDTPTKIHIINEGIPNKTSRSDFAVQVREIIKSLRDGLKNDQQVDLEDLVEMEILGKGSHGSVSRAFDKNSRNFYAVKVVKKSENCAEEKFIHIAKKELEVLHLLNETNNDKLMKIFDAFYDEDQNEFSMVLECGYGTLSDYCKFIKENNLSVPDAFWEDIVNEIYTQVLILKEAKICHQDIKPDNIIVSLDGQIKLTDYSEAKIFNQSQKNSLKIAGSPYYMSPELIQGYLEGKMYINFDPFKSDIYSIGLTILKLLEDYSNKEFRKDQGVDYEKVSNYSVVISNILKQIFESRKFEQNPISKDCFKEFFFLHKPDYQKYYNLNLVNKMFSSGTLLDHNVLKALGLFSDAETWLRKQISEMDSKNDNRYFSLKLQLLDCLNEQQKYEELGKNLHELEFSKIKQNPNLYSDFLINQGKYYIIKHDYSRAQQKFDEALKIKSKSNASDIELAKVYQQIGIIHSKLKDYEKSLMYYEKCLEIREKKFGCHSQKNSTAYQNIGIIYFEKKEYPKALKYYHKCYEVRIKFCPDNDPKVATILQNLGITCYELMKYEESIEYLQKCLNLRKKIFGNVHPKLINVYRNLGNSYEGLKKYHEALESNKLCLQISLNTSEKFDHSIYNLYKKLSDLYDCVQNKEESIWNLIQATEIGKIIFGENNYRLANDYLRIGELQIQKNNLEEAEISLSKAENIQLNYSKNSVDTRMKQIYELLIIVYEKLNKQDKSLEISSKISKMYDPGQKNLKKISKFK